MGMPLKSDNIYGNWGSLLLPINKDDSINYQQLEEELDLLISIKINGIYSNGTAGEFYNQTEDEFDKINLLLAEKCDKAEMPFQIGCSHMSPKISLERLRRVVALKPGAIQVILPDWVVPTMPEIIDYLQVMTEIANPIGLVLYSPPHAKMKLSPKDFHQLKEAGIPLVGCKLSGGDEKWFTSMKKFSPGLSLFVPGHILATGIKLGAYGSYSNVACLHPGAAQKWYEMMNSDMKSALEMEARIQFFFNNHIIPYITEKKFSDPAIDKFLAAVGGWANIGTRLRWPYKGINENEVLKMRKIAKNILPEFFEKNNL